MLLSDQTARRIVAFTPSTLISQQVDRLPATVASRVPNLTQPGVTAANSAGRAMLDGFTKGVSVNQAVGAVATLLPAASRRAFVLPYVGNLFVPQSAVWAIAAEFATTNLVDPGVNALLNRANERGSSAERVLGVAAKVGSWFLLEVPRLAVTSLRVGAALALGGAGAALGLGYYVLMASASAVRSNRQAPATAGEAAADLTDAAAQNAHAAADKVEQKAAEASDAVEQNVESATVQAEKKADDLAENSRNAADKGKQAA